MKTLEELKDIQSNLSKTIADLEFKEWERKPNDQKYYYEIAPADSFIYDDYFREGSDPDIHYNLFLSYNDIITNDKELFNQLQFSIDYDEPIKDIKELLKGYDVYIASIYTHNGSCIQHTQKIFKKEITKDFINRHINELLLVNKEYKKRDDIIREFKAYFNNEIVEVMEKSTLTNDMTDYYNTQYNDIKEDTKDQLHHYFKDFTDNSLIKHDDVYIKELDDDIQ